MNYYKVIRNDRFIGVATTYDFRRYQLKHHILLGTDEQKAEYVQVDSMLYHDTWLNPIITDALTYLDASISPITKEEYEALKPEPEPEPIPEEPEEPTPEPPQEPDPAVIYMREKRIRELTESGKYTEEDLEEKIKLINSLVDIVKISKVGH